LEAAIFLACDVRFQRSTNLISMVDAGRKAAIERIAL